jgi:hypothetical protein
MAQPARIPAWKRLGLKLQNSDQSKENHAPQKDHHEHVNISIERGAPLENMDGSPNEHIENKSSKLGKRKHRDASAEPKDETSKKSKSVQLQENDYGVADEPYQISADEIQLPEGSTSAPDTRPKGDPNYRKKKEKKGPKNKQKVQTAKTLPPVAVIPVKTAPVGHLKVNGTSAPSLRTPSLSPGRLGPEVTLLASTETDFPPSPPKRDRSSSSPPPRVGRRKSVTFTPDTKTVDGNSASNLFKKWVQDQKSAAGEFTEAEVAEFAPPPKSHPANDVPTSSSDTSTKKAKKSKTTTTANAPTPEPSKTIKADQEDQSATTSNKKKDPSRYLDYLSQYHTDRANWKFNKAKQNDVLDNALNIFRIPEEHSEALIGYVEGLQGAGVIERLKQRCTITIEEIDAAGTDSEGETMDDPKVRKAVEEEALQEQLAKQRKRRRLDRDIENMVGHPHTEGYIRRLKKGRAQALLKALNLAAPAPAPAPIPAANHSLPSQDKKAPKTKKMRGGDISSDESSDSSSSEESSSSGEEDSSDDDSNSDSDAKPSNKKSDSTSEEDNNSDSDSDSDSGSDSESN